MTVSDISFFSLSRVVSVRCRCAVVLFSNIFCSFLLHYIHLMHSNHFITISIYLLYYMQSVIFFILLSRIIILPHAYVRAEWQQFCYVLGCLCFYLSAGFLRIGCISIYLKRTHLSYSRAIAIPPNASNMHPNKSTQTITGPLAIEHAQLNQHH